MGENGQALTDYIEKTFNGQDEAYADHIWICSPNQKDCTNKFAIKADGEYIYIYKCIEQPKLPFTKDKICPVIDELGHWGGDSTGGRTISDQDVQNMFRILSQDRLTSPEKFGESMLNDAVSIILYDKTSSSSSSSSSSIP